MLDAEYHDCARPWWPLALRAAARRASNPRNPSSSAARAHSVGTTACPMAPVRDVLGQLRGTVRDVLGPGSDLNLGLSSERSDDVARDSLARSEERRVGKETRSRASLR